MLCSSFSCVWQIIFEHEWWFVPQNIWPCMLTIEIKRLITLQSNPFFFFLLIPLHSFDYLLENWSNGLQFQFWSVVDCIIARNALHRSVKCTTKFTSISKMVVSDKLNKGWMIRAHDRQNNMSEEGKGMHIPIYES